MPSVQIHPYSSILPVGGGAHITVDIRFEDGNYSAWMSGILWIEIDLPGRKFRTSSSFGGVWKGGKEILNAIAAFARQNGILDIQLRGPATLVEPHAVKHAFGVEPTFL